MPCQVGDAGHSPVQLGVLHQRVGVPVANEGPTCATQEALRVVLQLTGDLDGVVAPLAQQPLSTLQPLLRLPLHIPCTVGMWLVVWLAGLQQH